MDPTPPPRFAQIRTRRWPWLVAAASILAVLVANLLDPPTADDVLWKGMITVISVEFVVVGAVLIVRVPGNRVGAVVFGAGAMLAGTLATRTLSVVAAAQDDVPLAFVAITSILSDFGYSVPIVVVLIGVPLIFPDGHLLSPRWRWIVVLAIVALSGQAIARLVSPDPVGAAQVANPFAVSALEPLVDGLDAFAGWTSFIGFGAAALAIVIRYRRGNEIERHQLKWLIAVSAVAAVALPITFLELAGFFEIAFLLGLGALMALPVAIGIAILRYRLYDIDRIISRTISWTLVSGLLVAAFAIVVVGLQAALAGVTQGDTLAVAASTLVAFALFQPVRRTVQRTVDRRFDRARYDAQRTVDAFAERLRNEVDLDTLAADLERTVAGTVRPTVAAIWLPGRGS